MISDDERRGLLGIQYTLLNCVERRCLTSIYSRHYIKTQGAFSLDRVVESTRQQRGMINVADFLSPTKSASISIKCTREGVPLASLKQSVNKETHWGFDLLCTVTQA